MRKYTKTMFDREFPTDDVCLDFLFNARWPKGVICKKCEKITKHFHISGRKTYGCEFCGSQVIYQDPLFLGNFPRNAVFYPGSPGSP